MIHGLQDSGAGPTVLVSVPHGAAAGNMLRTGLVRRLLESDPRIHVVLLSPLTRDADFIGEHGHDRVHFEDLPSHRPAGLEARLLALMQAAYLDSGITESVRIRRAEALAKGTVRWLKPKSLIARAFAPSLARKDSRYALSDRLVTHPWADEIFARYRPVLLVVSSPGLIFSEVPLLRTAVKRAVPSMAVDASWDNFTNKILPVRHVNRLVVWNDLMKRQAIELHGYRAEEIVVTGTPQWDLYFREGSLSSREAFFSRVGADLDRQLVTLTTSPSELYGHFDSLIRALADAVARGAWGKPAQLLVRVHPRDDISRYQQFAATPHVMVEKPFRASVRSGDGMSVDVTLDSQRHLANTMRHSDVVVSVSSTIAIEGAIFDTPGVNIAFDGAEPLPYARSARRYLDFTHFTDILRAGAMRVAEAPEAMVEHIGRYLADPSLDRDGRRRVVDQQCQFTDGRAAERIADCVIAEVQRAAQGVDAPLPGVSRIAGLA